jgi:AcrR family transcriptional regulator
MARQLQQAASRRRRNAKGEGGRLRADLVEAAAEILAETGDEVGLSLRAVARRAGVSSPAVYLHFADKDALLAEVLATRFARLAEAVGAAVAGAHGSPSDSLRAGCRAYVDLALRDPGTYRVLFGGRRAADLGRETTAYPLDTPFRSLADGITAAQAAGAVRQGDPLRLAVVVWTALHGIATLRHARPRVAWPDAAELVDDVLEGLLGLPRP